MLEYALRDTGETGAHWHKGQRADRADRVNSNTRFHWDQAKNGWAESFKTFKQTLKQTFKKHKKNYYKLVTRFPDPVQEMLMHVKSDSLPLSAGCRMSWCPGQFFLTRLSWLLQKNTSVLHLFNILKCKEMSYDDDDDEEKGGQILTSPTPSREPRPLLKPTPEQGSTHKD